MDNRFISELKNLCDDAAIAISEHQLEQMNAYYEVLLTENVKYNLTRVSSPEEAALKHFFDSIVPCSVIPKDASLVDVGSGGGFPAAPLKIMRPDITATVIEASQKKCAFIEMAAGAAGIEIRTISERAEEAARGPLRESFDVLTARAVAALPILIEVSSVLVKPGGLLLYYKADYQEELEAAAGGMEKLHLKFERAIPLPVETLAHFVLLFTKTGVAAAVYPRRFAQIKKNPL